jgi:hypothetical protein
MSIVEKLVELLETFSVRQRPDSGLSATEVLVGN